MALDTKKVLAKVEKFKSSLKEADKRIDGIETAYSKAMSDQLGLGATIKECVSVLAATENMISTNLAGLKEVRRAAKALTGDVEMILRRAEENFDTLTTMANEFNDLQKALQKDKTNKDLIKKTELAERALDKQAKAAEKVALDASVVESSISLFEDNVDRNTAYDLARIKEMDELIKQLGKLFADKAQDVKSMNKILGR